MPVFESLISGTAISIVEQAIKGGKYGRRKLERLTKKSMIFSVSRLLRMII